MESFLPSEIARLVLGYLEDHKCEDAYEAFLKTSNHLVECLKMRDEGRKFRTQVLGLNLLDILYEYSAIYSLVEERLKKVDPETASSLKHSGSLLDKITFLLNATSSGQTMLFSITLPPGKSPSTAHVRKRLRSTTMNDKKKELRKQSRLNIEDLSPIVEVDLPAPQASTLETTSLSSLPGNANILLDRTETFSDNIVRTPKRKLNSSRRSRANSEIPEEEENLDITALTKALLDNHQLHEKIAENINKVIRTPEISTTANISQCQDLCITQSIGLSDTNVTLPNNFTLELDNAIKKIVQDTESDPLFENFLQEIICPADETSDDNEDKGISDTSTPCQSTPETVKKVSLKRLRSSTKKRIESPVTSSSEIITPTQIEHQNAAAVESIILMQKGIEPSKEEPKKPEEPAVPESNLQPTNNQPSTSGTNQTKKVPTQSMIYSDSIQYPQIQDNRVVILSSKISAGSQILTVQPGSFKTSYTEDILTMPTVIIKDDDINPSNTLVVPQKTFPLGNNLLLPKPKKHQFILPHPIITTNFTTIPTETITYPLEEPVVQQSSSSIVDIQQPATSLSVPIIPTAENEKLEKPEQQKTTPEKRDTKERLSLSTPRGARSHIRALDFSTPPKENPLRKSLSSPRVKRAKRATKPKPNQSRHSLFTSPLNMPIATRSPHEKLQGDWSGTEMLFEANKTEPQSVNNENKEKKEIEPQRVIVTEDALTILEKKVSKTKKKFDSWDHDLRVLLAGQQSEQPPEKKKKNPQKKKEEEITDKLSNTEEDAKAIEAALIKVEKKMNRKKPNENKPKPVRRKRQPKIKPAGQTEIKEVPLEVKDLNKKDEIQEEKIQQDGEKVKETQNKKVDKKNTTKETENKGTKEKVKTMKPRVKRKCNVTSSKKKTPPKPEKTNTVTVLSPSKYCATKRIVVEQDKPESKLIEEPPAINKPDDLNKPPEEPVNKPPAELVNKPPEEPVNKPSEECVSKPPESVIITPDMAKLFENNEIKIKRNLTPMLITPYKDESSLLPITPRILTPFGVDASFSSLIKQNCGTVDLSSIMTPNFPMTPSFPITPNLQTGDSQSSFASRPTDYSNSSSYYQPSDSEQNQKLEQVLIEEAMKLESAALKRAMWTSTPDKISNQELSVPPKDTMSNSAGETSILKEGGVLPKSSNSFENDYNLSVSSCDQSKENLQVESENTTVIHITPGQLRRGGKHMSMLKNLLKPVDFNSDSEVSNSPERNSKAKEKCETQNEKEGNISDEIINITDAIINLDERTHTKEENSESLKTVENSKSRHRGRKKKEESIVTANIDNKLNKAQSEVQQKRITRSKSVDIRKNTTDEDLGETDEISETLTSVNIKGKKKSNATAVHGNLLEELEEKRKRVINTLNTESSKPKVEKKRRGRGRPRSKSVDVRNKNVAENLNSSTDMQVNSDTSITMNTSHVRKIHSMTLEELEINQKRIKEEIRIEKAKIRLDQKSKGRPVKKGDPNRVTRARATAKKILEAEEATETIKTVEKSIKSVSTPKKNTSIEDVATRLKKDQDENVSSKEAVTFSANTSIDSHNTSFKKEMYAMTSDDYEDLPRLHISSDEETNECDIVKDLKERGIHLIPKKPVDNKKSNLKDEDNPRIINSQKLNLNITKEDETTTDICLDVEEKIPQNRIDKKIVIKSDVYLEESNKIDVSKVFSQNIVIESVITNEKKTTKKTRSTKKQQTLPEMMNDNKIKQQTLPEMMKNDNKIKQKKEIQQNKKQETKSKEKFDETPVTVTKTEKPETQKMEPEKKIDNSETQKENVDTCISSDVIFDDKIITEDSSEFIKVVHDESIVITKTIKDYDFNVLNRTITAKVFSEELNVEQDRTLTVTPFINVFSLCEKAVKPLDILFNEIQDDSTCSTIFDVSVESKNNKTCFKESVEQKNKTKERTRECYMKLRLSPEETDLERSYENVRKGEFDEVIKDNENILENKDEDDLMTFAVTARDTDKKGSPVHDSASRKRKAESEVLKSPNEKRAKTKDNALLKTLNVDQFLSMIHGPSCSKV